MAVCKRGKKQMIRTILATAISMLILSANAQAPLVSVGVDKPFYQPKDDIMVTIQNNRAVSIVTYDHQSYCSIVTLQLQTSSGGWVDLAPCRMGIPDRPVTFKPNETMKVNLPGADDPRPQGTYRVRFYYYLLGPDGRPVQPAYFVYSPEFQVAK